MLTLRLLRGLRPLQWRPVAARLALLALYVLMTVQFVGCYLFLGYPYLDIDRFTHGYERLPFQTRLLMAPLFRWAQNSPLMVHYASRLAMNGYFFPHGIQPAEAVQFWLDIPCVLIAGWVAVRIYQASSRRRLLGWLVYPLFLVLCAVSYTLHTVQNFQFVYDLPSLAFFSLGLYLIYFRKSKLLLVALFAVATLNRETTLFLIPFYLLSEWTRSRDTALTDSDRASRSATSPSHRGADRPAQRSSLALWPVRPAALLSRHRDRWQRTLSPEVIFTASVMLAYWAVWHVLVFHLFRHNASEYYPRFRFNLYCFRRLRYYPQLFSACGYLLPFLLLFHRRVRDAQLRVWMLMIPVWYAIMMCWGILVETRVFGELLPFIACTAVLIAEEAVVAAVQSGRLTDSSDDEEDEMQWIRAA